MAGANNKSLKAMGFKQAGIETIRSGAGGALSLRSAIEHARTHGLAVPADALRHVGGGEAPTNWKRAAEGKKPVPAGWAQAARGEGGAERRAINEARAARVSAMQAARAKRTGQIAGTMGTMGRAMLASRKAVQAAAAKPKFKGAGEFNSQRHIAKADALIAARKKALSEAGKNLAAAAGGQEHAQATKAHEKAFKALRRANALGQRARSKAGAATPNKQESALDRFRAEMKARQKAEEHETLTKMVGGVQRSTRRGREALASAPRPRGGLERSVEYNQFNNKTSVRNVKPIAKSGDFFVHKTSGGGGYAVTHRPTGTAVYSSHSLSATKAAMDGVAKTGSKTLSRIEGGDLRAAKALRKYRSRLESARFYNLAHAKYGK